MQNIKALLLEPIGCLAEFPAAPFHEIATRFFGRKGKASTSASREYWHLLNLLENPKVPLTPSQLGEIEALETQAAQAATLYDDVHPVLAELKSMEVRIILATSVSICAMAEFLERNSLEQYFFRAYTRDHAEGVKSVPLLAALDETETPADHAIFLTDTLEGIKVARAARVHPILMMNDPDEAQRLAAHHPDGGVVSLHEIPDFIRLVAAQNANP